MKVSPSVFQSQLMSIEVILAVSSLCVSGILIFLSVMARLALKSTNTHTQVIYYSYLPVKVQRYLHQDVQI